MALIKCPSCGQLISERANRCPKCGAVVPTANNGGNSFQQPIQEGYQQPPQGGYQQPVQGGYQQQPQVGYQQPMQGGYQQPPQGGYQQPMQGGYQQPPQGWYQQPMQGGYQQPMQVGYQQGPRIKSEYSMSFGEAIGKCFNNYSEFDGRARRKEYWYFTLFTFLIYLLLTIISFIIGLNSIQNGGASQTSDLLTFFKWFNVFVSVILLIPSLSVFWRRMHDIGRSGGWFFIAFIPIVGFIILLIFLCKAGDIGDNEYDEDPKYEIEGTNV